MAEQQDKRRIRVVISDEDLETVQGQGLRGNYVLPEGVEEAEGQLYRVVPKDPDEPDDTGGQGFSSKGLGQTEDDVEGQSYRFKLEPVDPADAEGHGVRGGWLVPERTGDAGPWRFEPDDDTEGHGAVYNH